MPSNRPIKGQQFGNRASSLLQAFKPIPFISLSVSEVLFSPVLHTIDNYFNRPTVYLPMEDP
ncbi:hypothetical protein [Methylacidiphilum sp. Yel]|uniref:hypothetical protein n=1 Tax=Methylacidiphilum sp. Yel TaxID=1847730 RepID=UPI00106AD930|nr:hypothetical protein [Methylacidiphilum sp. Yel]